MRGINSEVAHVLSRSTVNAWVLAVGVAVVVEPCCRVGGRSHEGESHTGDDADLHLDEWYS
jgi:hypothetical protein